MNHFIKLSEIKLKEEEMGNARGGQTANIIGVTVNPIEPPVVCYGVPDPPHIIISDPGYATDIPK